jgi:hypothetical protein
MPGIITCDFCGSTQGLRSYPIDIHGSEWDACAICVRLIRDEDWNNFIERIIAAFAALQFIPEDEQAVFRKELANALCHGPESSEVARSCSWLSA